MGKRIEDQFTGLAVSRQRRWQLRKLASGKCIVCGRRRINAKFCRVHRGRVNAKRRKAKVAA